MIPWAATAATYTLISARDTFADEAAPTANNATLDYIALSSAAGTLKRSVLDFTMPAIPSSEYVSSATMRLWVVDGGPSPIDVHRVTSSWDSATVNWNNMPSYNAASSVNFSAGTAGVFVEVDVTALVRAWVEGTVPNYGVMLIVRSGTAGIQFSANNTTVDGQDPTLIITTEPRPSLAMSVSTQASWDPYNANVNPKRIPGAVVQHSVVVSNSAAGTPTGGSVVVIENVPSQTALFVGDLGAAGSGPIAFTNGSPSSGLTYTFSALASTTDNVSFSNNGGASFSYTPVPDAGGYDAAVTTVRVNPQGVFAANTGAGSPSFTLRMRLRNK